MMTEQFAVTPAEWPQLQAQASKALGATISGDSGSATEPTHGIEFTWSYDPTAQQLTLNENVGGIEGHFVKGKVTDAVNAALQQIRNPQPPGGQP